MRRRTFVQAVVATASSSSASVRAMSRSSSSAHVDALWRSHFPALQQQVNGRPLVYLDTAATALRPRQVMDAVSGFYAGDNANPGGALHTLARRAAARMEGARRRVASFIGARDPLEVCFTRGTTEGINLVARAWGDANVGPADEILIGRGEHASNMLPWQQLALRRGAIMKYFELDGDGRPRLDDIRAKLTARTRVVAFTHVSNVLGLVNPAAEMCALARGPGRIVVVDGAQSVPHIPVSVADLDCDFLAFSSHKMLGPMGTGVLWGRRELLDAMPAWQSGSNAAHDVTEDNAHWSEGALKFSAGTPDVAGPVGLATAIELLASIGMTALTEHERRLTARVYERLASLPRVRLLGAPDPGRVSVFSFAVDGVAPLEVVRAMDASGIAIRAGDLASLPLLRHFGLTAAARISAYLYTTPEEIDAACDVLASLTGR